MKMLGYFIQFVLITTLALIPEGFVKPSKLLKEYLGYSSSSKTGRYTEKVYNHTGNETNLECNDDVQCTVNLIEQANRNALTYEYLTNAEEYAPNSNRTKDFGVYDFIVVGSGASGSVVANRLSENCGWKILLVEAGSFGNDLTDIPVMGLQNRLSRWNWGFQSVPQTTCCLGLIDQMCPYHRGRGVGGTTLINGLVYSRGAAEDFDKWRDLGNPGWSYEELLPVFKKSEHFIHNDITAPVEPQYHGESGPLNVQYHLPRNPQLDAFRDANKEIGVKILDYNGRHGLGMSLSQINTNNGRRADGGTSFIIPILYRKNLRVMTESYVTKINFFPKSNRVAGVTFSHNQQLYRARVTKEVIISGGAIQSPQILMLSGIGPKKHLDSLGIPVVKDLEVGSNFIDHPSFFGLTFNTSYSVPNLTLTEQVKQYLAGFGPLAVADSNQGNAYYLSSFSTSQENPDFEIVFRPSLAVDTDITQRYYRMTNDSYQSIWGNSYVNSVVETFFVGLHPESKGTIRLKSKNPYDYPLIDPRMYSDQKNKDIQVIYEAIQLMIRLTETEAMKRINTTINIRPLNACRQHTFLSKEYFYCAIRHLSNSDYHPINTCPMGPNPEKGGVVDHDLKVHGIRGLRVADASVIPLPISGHPNAVCVMIGEKAAISIKKQYTRFGQ